jgi:membrane protease YdiL (CAAX protease family)
MEKNIKKSILFIGLTFSLSWLIAILFFILGGKWNTPISMVVGVVYMFVPMTIAIIVQKFIYREPLKEPLGISFKLNRWFLVAWLLPPIVAFATLGVSLLFPGIEYSSEMAGMFERFRQLLTPEQFKKMEEQAATLPIHPFWIVLLQGLVAGITINAVVSFGEELGWRGLLQKELGFLGFWKSSVVIGVIWGVWHAPIILQGHNYPQHPIAGVFMMMVFCVLLAPIFSYVRLKAKSVIAAAVIHGSLNGTIGLAIIVVKGGNDLIIGGTGLAGFIVLAVVNLGIFVYNKFLAKDIIRWKGESVNGTGK